MVKMDSNQIKIKITKQMKILNDNVTQLLAKKMLQSKRTQFTNDTSSTQTDIEPRFIELSSNTTSTLTEES